VCWHNKTWLESGPVTTNLKLLINDVKAKCEIMGVSISVKILD